MNTKLPRTPFATSLSGSAKETELRIKSILHGPKKRPPFWMMALTALTILLCGSLVSCQPEQEMILYYDPSNLTQSMVDQMYQEVAEQSGLDLESGTVEKTLMSAKTIGDHVLTSAYIHDDYPRYTFVLGVSALGESELIGPAFTANNSGGIPRVHNFEKDGKDYLLYTANGSGQGYSHGEAGLVTLDGDQLTWLWPVEGDVRDENSAAHHNYYTFWENQKALMSPGGVDILWKTIPRTPIPMIRPSGPPTTTNSSTPSPRTNCPSASCTRRGSGWRNTPVMTRASGRAAAPPSGPFWA